MRSTNYLVKCLSMHCLQNRWPHTSVWTASFSGRWHIGQIKSSSTAFTNLSSYPLGKGFAWASAMFHLWEAWININSKDWGQPRMTRNFSFVKTANIQWTLNHTTTQLAWHFDLSKDKKQSQPWKKELPQGILFCIITKCVIWRTRDHAIGNAGSSRPDLRFILRTNTSCTDQELANNINEAFVSVMEDCQLYFKHEFKCFIAISNNEKTIETRGPPGPSVLLFSSCLSSQWNT